MKKVIITGGSRGIGKAAVELFSEDCQVAFTYNNAEAKAMELADKTGALCFKANFENESETRNVIRSAAEKLGGVDLLINNAGVCSFGVFNNISEAEWGRVMSVNLNAPYRAIQEVLPFMLQKQQGCIINVSSIWGVAGSSCEVAYSTAKAGLIGMTKALAKELAPSNIRVNCIAPGVIDTDMNACLDADTVEGIKEDTPLGRLGTPCEIAHAMKFFFENNFTTGQILTVDGGFIL